MCSTLPASFKVKICVGDGGEPSFDNEDQVVISEWNKFYNLYEIILGWSLKCKRRIEKKSNLQSCPSIQMVKAVWTGHLPITPTVYKLV